MIELNHRLSESDDPKQKETAGHTQDLGEYRDGQGQPISLFDGAHPLHSRSSRSPDMNASDDTCHRAKGNPSENWLKRKMNEE